MFEVWKILLVESLGRKTGVKTKKKKKASSPFHAAMAGQAPVP